MTKHTCFQTTLITDRDTAFTSNLVAKITQFLGIQLECATTKHLQTTRKLERTHDTLMNSIKIASGEYRCQWRKYLPMAVLNYNTSHHSL